MAMRKLSVFEKQQTKWEAALQRAWLADHPGKTVDDYEIAGSCADTDQGARAFLEWYAEWMTREGGLTRTRIFKRDA
jgi:hypothetical protein